jgi:hypothetical protein
MVQKTLMKLKILRYPAFFDRAIWCLVLSKGIVMVIVAVSTIPLINSI